MKATSRVSCKLSPASRAAILVGLACLSMQPASAQIVPTGNTSIRNQNGVDIVNIAAPNNQGLSHNKYNQYNVSTQGAVLNNALQSGQSQLAGQLASNNNLNGRAAKVILNEVISQNPSLLLGKQEVFGVVADYILANPNGITCNNCGFINTPRASLVVGSANLTNGNLNDMSVGAGANKNATLSVEGNVTAGNILDLVAPKIQISANLNADQTINVFSGRNNIALNADDTIAIKTLTEPPAPPAPAPTTTTTCFLLVFCKTVTTPAPVSSPANVPSQVLDASIFGRLQAGRIRLYNLDSAATTLIQAQLTGREFITTDINGKLAISGSQLQAGSASLQAGDLAIGAIINTTTNQSQDRQDGYRNIFTHWTHDTTESATNQTAINSNITTTGDLTLRARNGSLEISGATVNAGHLILDGAQQVKLKGITTTNSASHEEKFEHESADNLSGYITRAHAEDSYSAAIITADNIDISANGTVTLAGAKLLSRVGMSVNAESVNLLTEATNKSDVADQKADSMFLLAVNSEQQNTHVNRETTQHGTSLTAAGGILAITGRNTIAASGAKLQGGAVLLSGTTIAFDQAVSRVESSDAHHTNGSLNAPQYAYSTSTLNETALPSEITSIGGDVNVSGSNLSLTGTTLTAGRQANIYTSNSTSMQGADEVHSRVVTDWSPSFDSYLVADGATPQVSTDMPTTFAELAQMLKNQGGGWQWRIGARFDGNTHEVVDKTINRHRSQIVANQLVNIYSGDQLNVAGSTLQANAGQSTITAQTISLTAEHDTVIHEDNKKTNGIGPYFTFGLDRIGVGVDMVTFQNNTKEENDHAQVSIIQSRGDTKLTGLQRINNQGAAIVAGNQLTINAGEINNTNANDLLLRTQVLADLGLEAEVFASLDPKVGGRAAVFGDLEIKRDAYTRAIASHMEGADITVTANNDITDTGSSYKAPGNIKINTVNYVAKAAENVQLHTDDLARGKLELQVYTTTFDDVAIEGIVSGQLNHTDKGTAQAVKSSFNANNLLINASNNLESSADITTKDSVKLLSTNLTNVNFATNRSWENDGGFNASIGLGVDLIFDGPGGVIPVPMINLAGGFNYKNIADTQAVAADITGNTVTISGGNEALVQGANINALNDVNLIGARAWYDRDFDTHHADGIAIDGSFDFQFQIGKNFKVGVGGDLDFIDENSTVGHGGTVTAHNMTILANTQGSGALLAGTKITADNVSVINKAGDISITAAQGDGYVADFGGGFIFGIGVATKGLDNVQMGARVDLNFENEHTSDVGTITAKSLTMTAGNNLTLQGTSVFADTVSGSVGKDMMIASAVERDNKFRFLVDFGIGASSKPIDTMLKGANAVRKNLLNGDIFGFSPHAKFDGQLIDYLHTEKSLLSMNRLNLSVGGTVDVDAATILSGGGAQFGGAPITTASHRDKNHRLSLAFDVSTNVFKTVQQGIYAIDHGTTPWIQGDAAWSDALITSEVNLKL